MSRRLDKTIKIKIVKNTKNVRFSFTGYDTLYEAICAYTCRSRILSGLVWVSIKIIIAGREAFLSNIKKPVRFGIGCNSQLPSRRLIYTLPHFVFAWLNEIVSNRLCTREKFALPIKNDRYRPTHNRLDCLSTI